jgi:hypothetical protein
VRLTKKTCISGTGHLDISSQWASITMSPAASVILFTGHHFDERTGASNLSPDAK